MSNKVNPVLQKRLDKVFSEVHIYRVQNATVALGRPIGMARWCRGVSYCNIDKDRFNKAYGRDKAVGRLLAAFHRCENVESPDGTVVGVYNDKMFTAKEWDIIESNRKRTEAASTECACTGTCVTCKCEKKV